MVSVVQWLQRVQHTTVTAPGGVGGECVDLANSYLVQVHGELPVRANAAGWTANVLSSRRWRFVLNTPVNYPPTGSIVVWGGAVPALGIGPNGHVAVALLADGERLWTLDQNWAGWRSAEVSWHSYAGVTGWWGRVGGHLYS